jgi:hypothetical protein
MSTASGPILTDEQQAAVMRACQPLQVPERQAFLASLTQLLRDRSDVGDGELFRMLRELLRQGFFRPPEVTKAAIHHHRRVGEPIP